MEIETLQTNLQIDQIKIHQTVNHQILICRR